MSNIRVATDQEPVEFEFDRLTWLDSKEAAEYLRKTANALRIMVYRNQIKVYKFGRRLRFKLSDCQCLVSLKGA